MAPTKSCLHVGGNVFPRNIVRHQKPLRTRRLYNRQYVTSGPVKPRPYEDKTKAQKITIQKTESHPLVGVRTQPAPGPKAAPAADPKANAGVYAPYWRISLGVLLCGSMIYSMVTPTILRSPPKLTYMHTSSPHPSSSKLPQLPNEISSQSVNQA